MLNMTKLLLAIIKNLLSISAVLGVILGVGLLDFCGEGFKKWIANLNPWIKKVVILVILIFAILLENQINFSILTWFYIISIIIIFIVILKFKWLIKKFIIRYIFKKMMIKKGKMIR